MDKAQKCSALPEKLPPLLLLRLFGEVVAGSGGVGRALLQTVSYLSRSAVCLQACSGLSPGWVAGFTGLPALSPHSERECLDLGVTLETIIPPD